MQRLQRIQNQLKSIRHAAADATPESKWKLLYDIGDHISENISLNQ